MTPQFTQRLTEIADLVEASLAQAITLSDAPPRLAASMRHAALGGGKRLRPFLLIETAALFGCPAERALPAALAVELVHCYSLVHDDLPAMDDDDMRRGRPTVHVAFDEATAILVGDALLTLAFGVVAESPGVPGPVVARLVARLAQAAGAGGMVGGQMLDLTAEGRFDGGTPLPLGVEAVAHLQSLKTGALFRFAIEAGAMLGAADAAQRTALATFADKLGLAFQLSDDLLDVEGDAARVGKATQKDAVAGKGTLVSLLGVAEARARLDAIEAEAIAVLAPFGDRAGLLVDGLRFVARRDS
jgi:farnesyl diphosphate synthase